MDSKTLIWGGMFVGGTVGGFLPYVWGGGLMAGVFWSAVGGVIGIWAGYKLAKGSGAL
jgi:hypothetical protein